VSCRRIDGAGITDTFLLGTEGAMQGVARITDKIGHRRAALAAMLVACFAVCAFDATAASSMDPGELTLQIKPLKAAVNEDENIGWRWFS